MRRYLHVPQISAVMGSCVAGGAYLPAFSDVIFMVEGTSFMGLGGPNLVKGATGQTIDAETLGGARTHTERSAVAHYRAANDTECLERIREYIARLPRSRCTTSGAVRPSPARPPADLYDILPQDHRLSYDMRQVLGCLLDGGALDEFQPDIAREMLCGHGHIEGRPVAVITNQRGVIKGQPGERPRFGGIVYTGSAEKVAYFIETASRERLPILFIQDVSGFMVGPEAEQSGIIRAGAHFVEAMATAMVPKIVLTVNHASGAGYYAMAGQGFDPDFILSWPTGRMAVMEGESAVMAVHGAEIEKARREGREPSAEAQASMSRCGRITSTSSTRVCRCPWLRGCHRHSGRDPRPARFHPAHPANYAGPHSAPSSSRRLMRLPPVRSRMRLARQSCQRWFCSPAPAPGATGSGTRRPSPSSIQTRDPAPVPRCRLRKHEQTPLRPMVPPSAAEVAYAHGWMPLASTGVDKFLRRTRPSTDGAC